MATFAARCASLLGRTCTKNEAHGGAGYVALLGDFGEIFVFFRKISDFEPTKRLLRPGGGMLIALHVIGTRLGGAHIERFRRSKRPFKIKLRKRLAKEPGGRMVMGQEEMWEICKEVWDSIDPKEFRPYFTKAASMWEKCEKAKGGWIGWGKAGNAAHGISL